MSQRATIGAVRPVQESDVPGVLGVVSTVLTEFGLRFGDGAETDAELEQLPGSYRERGGRFWVALDERGELVGTCGMFPVGERCYELRKMYLLPAARGLGLGRRLLDAAIGWVRGQGARKVVLDTTEQMEQAIAFYEARGFVRDDGQIRGSRCSRGYVLDLD
jgi:GNAT superfamily N-acetyltransferase